MRNLVRLHRPHRIALLLAAAVALCSFRVDSADGSSVSSPGPRDEQNRENPSQTVPDDDTLERLGATIGSIIVRPGTIFEHEDGTAPNRVFRVANRLHIRTRESTIRTQLTFKEGDRYSRAALAESERSLRRNGYLYDATVRPVRLEGNEVTVEVTTRDTWTTKVGIGFKRSGGANKTHFGLAEGNFLGFGKHVEVGRSSDVDRTETLFSYRDRNLGGTHAVLDADYSSNSDGKLQAVTLGRPFYSLDTRWALGGRGELEDRTDSLYELGMITNQFTHHRTFFEGYYGWSPGLVGGRTRRVSFGFTSASDQFAALPGSASTPPPDRTLAYPWIGIDVTRDGFIRARDMDKLGRTEDLNLSHDLHARLGFSSPVFGGDRNEAIFEASYRNGLNPGNGQILLLSTGISGRLDSGNVENGLFDASIRYFNRTSDRRMFYIGISTRAGVHLDLDQQLLLGGDNGLRGYPLRYATGERTAIFTVEQRFYWDKEIFHLCRIGAAVFADAGEAWGGSGGAASQLDVLRDVGFGLRIGQTRSSHASMLKIDIAFPLDGGSSIHGTQLLVTTGETF